MLRPRSGRVLLAVVSFLIWPMLSFAQTQVFDGETSAPQAILVMNQERLLRNSALIQRLARLSEVAVADQAPDGSVTIALTECAVNLPLKGVIDVAAESVRLKKALDKVSKEIMGLEKKLSNQGFLAKAPEEVVEEQRERLAAAQSEAGKLQAASERLASLGSAT